MKTLILVRHAKSSWGNLTQPDFDRPLNDRGKKDAPEMAERLKARGIVPDALISSPAKRAKKTAQAFAEVFTGEAATIHFKDELYHASPATFQEIVAHLDDAYNTVLLFSHNPGITIFAAEQGVAQLDNMPTCGVFAVSANCAIWKDFRTTEKKFLFFDFPKNHLQD